MNKPKTKPKVKSKKRKKYEEIVNSSSHGIGVLIAVACTAILATRAAILGNAWHIVTFSIFGAGMINLYTASTLFHASVNVKKKSKLNKFDHSSIYVLIAATYTPISLVGLKGAFGWVIFGLIWAMALFGIVYKIWFYSVKFRTLSTILYIAMGWLILIAIVPIIQNLPNISLWFLLAGGLSYSFGTIFYINRDWPYGHGIFHLFILGGSICHFFAVLFLI
ncbi:MAG TPA: hemolysin III family protein [Tenuifilaceae bacterium]|nr:hemolysin III family protein [Tenuifilaceae bacterium]